MSLLAPIPVGPGHVTRSQTAPRLVAKVEVGEKGRIVIPAAMREALGIQPGSFVELELHDYELRLTTRGAILRRAQEFAKTLVPPGTRVSDELIADRREEAKHE